MKTASIIKFGFFFGLTLGVFISTSFAQTLELSEGSIDKTALLESRIQQAGNNRDELRKAIKTVPQEHRQALEFLLMNMPQYDLQNLTAEFLLTNIRLAYQAREAAPWDISDQLFLNNVLPYANIDEPRDPWREDFFKLCQPIIANCKTPGEAAQKINATIFGQLSVKYSTARKRANQSPKESIEQGLASCTGLSILLADACRSVGVPARLAGIPSWKNKNGNHTWVEVWDDGWQFTGAAEHNPQGLNRTWFQGDAALADPDSKLHSIYAASFQKTETAFPMVWSPEKRVFAENVTRRYIPKTTTPVRTAVDVMVRVWNGDKSQREIVNVEVLDSKTLAAVESGTTKAGTADMNDMLSFRLAPGKTYRLRISQAETILTHELKTNQNGNQLVELRMPNQDDSSGKLSSTEKSMIKSAADKFFGETEVESIDQLLREKPAAARQLAWEQYLASPASRRGKSDFDKNQVTFKNHLSPYTIKTVGKRPANGWPLFIAMHGGGGAPQELNDSQWRHMQIYYKDQKQVTGYKYLALRAPNNTWNGFYDDYVYPLIENLIRQFMAFGDVDPNKVFIMGYSHGGYGAFSIGPKIPYRFAAIHASAAAPTGGQTTAKTLRNTRFSFMVGEGDTAYGRRERCEQFAKEIKELGYDNVEFMYKPGFGHGGLPDRDMIGEMYDYQRNAAPRHVTWQMTDSVVDRFFWLATDSPQRGQLIDAEINGNQILVKTENLSSFSIFLDSRLIDDPKKPIQITLNHNGKEKKFEVNYKPSFETLCRSLVKTGDIYLSYDFEIKINVED
ncbi:MAG: hypothetical protein OSA89_08740 [Mariniblastus sp.]|nr:hypothetical protein [Mariniblastus sp.]